MNINDLYPSKYVKASDLNGVPHTVKIQRIEVEEMSDGKRKPVMYFAGRERGLVLNKTNGLAIAARFGPELANWIGGEIELFATIVQGPNGPVEGIRVRPLDKPAEQKPAQAAAAAQPQF